MTREAHATVQEFSRRKRLGRAVSAIGFTFVLLTVAAVVSANSPPDAGPDDTAREIDAADLQQTPVAHRALTVCVSPGHPSYEGDKYYEAVLNRRVAYKLKVLLLEAGYDVVMSTDDLTDETLFAPGFDSEDETYWEQLEVKTPEEKAAVCNDAGADFGISIHHNFAYNPETNYTMVFYGANEGDAPDGEEIKKWAESTARALSRVMKTDGSRVYADLERLGFTLSIVANSNAPTILTEGAFYSNPRERRRLSQDAYIEQEAKAIFDAFHARHQVFAAH